jgi:hypothetical protein
VLEGGRNNLQPVTDEQTRQVSGLIAALDDSSQQKRREARLKLMAMGQVAMPAILSALFRGPENSRWQAAKALSQLRDPATAPALVKALQDNSFGVRWLAAEGLIGMGCAGLEPLLEGLICEVTSVWLRDGAHHILHALHDNGLEHEACAAAERVLVALEGGEPTAEVPWAAEMALKTLRKATEPYRPLPCGPGG